MQEAVRDRPSFGVIRGAMGGVWLGGFFYQVYEGKM
jgi:hypothetical protein